jgi:hypothetical protein
MCGSTGCSRGYKTGAAITSADLVKALPEFPITLPPGGTNLYLEHDPRRPLVSSWLKVSVPTTSLTNFLRSFGFADEFTVATPQMIRLQSRVSLPAAMDARNPVSWALNTPKQAHHAAEWDINQAPGPIRMYLVGRPGMSSPNDKVVLFGYVNEPAASNVTLYLEYHCLRR